MPAAVRIGDNISCGDHVAMGSPNVFIENKPAGRQTDMTTGHGCFFPTRLATGAATVYVNNLALAVVGLTQIIPHACVVVPPHPGTSVTGAATVYAQG